jgi:hypothetical protein
MINLCGVEPKNIGFQNLTFNTLRVPSLHNNNADNFILILSVLRNGFLLNLGTHYVLMEHTKETQGRQVRGWGLRGGGVIFEPEGNRVLDSFYNLGTEKNNKVEAYIMIQGIDLEKKRKIEILNVVGDRKMIIITMIWVSSPHNTILRIFINIILLLTRSMQINYFHILQNNNEE